MGELIRQYHKNFEDLKTKEKELKELKEYEAQASTSKLTDMPQGSRQGCALEKEAIFRSDKIQKLEKEIKELQIKVNYAKNMLGVLTND